MTRRGPLGRRLLVMAAALFLSATAVFAGGTHETQASNRSGSTINIVAAENFYGDVAQQIAGPLATVTSILSNPNVDPHEYESSVANAAAVANAALVIENGGGYDAWMNKLLSASPNPSRIVIDGFAVAPTHLPENEHVFYGIGNMSAIAKAIRNALTKIDPANAKQFAGNYETFQKSLTAVTDKLNEIKSKYSGTPVGLTETIFLYQAKPMGLDVLTPFAFQKAIAEGNDPPANAAIAAQKQVVDRRIRVLIYNEQTVTAITTKLQKEARAAGIPVVPVTETMPPSLHYQSWMMKQLNNLMSALGSRAAG